MKDKTLSLWLKEGFRYNEEAALFWGKKEGYSYYLKRDSHGSYRFHFCVSKEGKAPKKDSVGKLSKNIAAIDGFQAKNYHIVYRLAHRKNPEEFAQLIQTTLQELLELLERKQWLNCDEEKGEAGETSLYLEAETIYFWHKKQFEQRKITLNREKEEFFSHKIDIEKALMGTFLGGMAGALVIIVSAQMHLLLGLAGLIMGVLTIYGLRFTKQRLSKKLILYVHLLMIALILLANHINFALLFSRLHPQYSWKEAFVGGISLFGNGLAYYGALFQLLLLSSFVSPVLYFGWKKQLRGFYLQEIEKA